MELDKNSTLFKVFSFCYSISQRFGANPWFDVPTKTNLCQMLRVMCIWAPIAIILNIAAIAALLYSLVYFPIFAIGVSYLITVAIVAIATIAVAVLAYVAFLASTITGKVIKHPTTQLVYRSFKDKYCPIIHVEDKSRD